jgi:ubiquinone/menaquinone biosynthesis C-methylase UbiE
MEGVLDWSENRKSMLLSTHRIKSCNPSYWDKCAIDFNENTAHMHELTKEQVNRLPLMPEHTVLEIGAGTGRITIPVAQNVKQVTAVEPSARMLAFLRANAQKAHVNNISYINKPWEELNVGDVSPHDFVVASFSFFMVDLAKELMKMHILANERVYLFLSASNWMDKEIQKIIYDNTSPLVLADHIYIYNILNELGITANVEIWNYDSNQRYRDLDDAVSRFMDLYSIPPKKEEQVREYLRKILVADNEGWLWLRHKKKVAMIWWAKTQ